METLSRNGSIHSIPRADNRTKAPLTFFQEYLWDREKENPGYNAFHLPTALRIYGRVDIQALEFAFTELIRRHELLRINILLEEGHPCQTVREETKWKLDFVDLSNFSEAGAEEEAFVCIEKERGIPFDLQSDSLLRTTLYKLNSRDFILFINMHQMVSDRQSLYILTREVGQLYDSFLRKEMHTIRPLPVQFPDFAVWQRRFVQQQTLDQQHAYWSNRLKDTPPLELPTDYVRPPNPKFNNDVITIKIPKQSVQGVVSLSEKEGVSTYVTLLAAYTVLLHRYSEQKDFCIGWVNPSRNIPEFSSLIGPFANTLILRIDLSGNPCFLELLHRVRETITAACAHADLPFGQIVESLKEGRLRSFPPLIQVSFAYDAQEENKKFNHDLDITMINTLSRSPGLDLSMNVIEIGDELTGSIEYNAEIFKRENVERMMIHFTNVIIDTVRNPGKKLGEVELLTVEEKEEIVVGRNETEVEYPKSVCVHTLFEEQVEKTPDHIALIHGDQVLTYRELNEKSNQLANYLKKRGVSKETLVGLCLDLSFEFVVGLLGIIKAGGAYVPLDPRFPFDHLARIMNDCKAPFLITKHDFLGGLPKQRAEVILIDQGWKDIESEPNVNPENILARNNLFYVIYTSGSTGKPKGVAGIYEGIINRLCWMWEAYPFTENEVCCMKTSINFVDHVAEILGPLLKGIPLVIFPQEEGQDAEKLVDLIIDKKITRIVLVPSQLRKMLSLGKEKLFKLKDLKYVFCSGEALSVRLAKQFYQAIRNGRLVNIYGSTEVSADVTYYEVKRFHVDDVLRYFTRSIELPGGLIEAMPSRYPNPISAERITTANIDIDQIARKLTATRITEYPMTLDQYYKKLYTDVLPFVINTAAPTFVGHMTSALPDFVHDLSKLISQLNQNLVKIETGKSLILLEREALAILHRCFYECPDAFYESYAQRVNMNLGLVTTGGTTANIIALLTARNKALFHKEDNPYGKSIYALLREKNYQDMTILGSRLMHYSMRKSTSVLGLGIDTIMYVDSDQKGKLDLRDLEHRIEECQQRRILVLAIVGIAGATETGQIDPLEEMGDLANSHGIHFHVDAAWGGTTILSDTHKSKLRGIQKADSITFCGHKQLYLPQGISICLFKDPRQAQYAATSATYQALPNTYDVGRFSLEGSRSAISLCLHAALRLIGKKGYEMLVDRGIEMAVYFAELIKSTDWFELIGCPELNIVNYRYIPSALHRKTKEGMLTDEDNQKINDLNTRIQESQFFRAKTFVSKTTLFHTKYGKGKEIVVLRVVLSNPLTTQADIYSVLEDQIAIAKELFGETSKVSFGEERTAVGKEWENTLTNKPVFVDENLETSVPIGKPLANCKVYILDKYGNPTPTGVPGELCVAGAAVSRGYFNRPELTNEVFVPNPFDSESQGRLFKTGDRAKFLCDGNMEYLGRTDDQIKIQGYRIETSEIELALGEVEHVQQCAVVSRTTAEGKVLIAYIVLKKDLVDISVIRRTLAEKLPDYMMPSMFIVIEEMPLTPNGKINKKALAESDIAATLAIDRH